MRRAHQNPCARRTPIIELSIAALGVSRNRTDDEVGKAISIKLLSETPEYPWSAHRAYLGEEALPWLTTDWVLARIGKRCEAARRSHGAFIGAGLERGHRAEFHQGATAPRLLNDERFTEAVLAETGARMPPVVPLDELIERVANVEGIDPPALSPRWRQRPARPP